MNSIVTWRRGLLVLGLILTCTAWSAPGASASFGTGGRVEVPGSAQLEQVVRYGQGRSLLFGSYEGSELLRLRADGSLDKSFGEDGRVTISPLDVAVQPDGRIDVLGPGGTVTTGPIVPTVTRLLPNGKVDRSFGDNGVFTVDFGDKYNRASSIAVLPNGKIVVAGRSGSAVEQRSGTLLGDDVIMRLLPGGAVDRSFSGDGQIEIEEGQEISDIVPAPGGELIARIEGVGVNLFKFRRGGAPDSTFGDGGHVYAINSLEPAPGEDFFQPVPQTAVLPNGKILLAGTVSRRVNNELLYRVMAVRLRADGSLDRSYGSHGYARAGFAGGWCFAGAMTVKSNGAMFVASSVQIPDGHRSRLAAIAFGPDGKLDGRFGQGGKLHVGFPGWTTAIGAFPQGSNRLVLVGSSRGEATGAAVVLTRVPQVRRNH